MIETYNTKNHSASLFPPPCRNRAGFTQEEIQDIQRFVDTYNLQGAAKAKLLARIRDGRAAHTIQKRKAEQNLGNHQLLENPGKQAVCI